MPITTNSDAECIQSAYEGVICDLFKQLCKNLDGLPDGPGDPQYIAMFAKGYGAAKHAKDLALKVVGPAATTLSSAATK